MVVSVENFGRYKKERGGLSPEGFEAYKGSVAVIEKPGPAEEKLKPDLMQRLHRGLRAKVGIPEEFDIPELVGGLAERGLGKWRESDIPLTAESPEAKGMSLSERYIANIGRTLHALPRFPIDIVQQIAFTEEKELRPPLEVGKEMVKTGAEFLEWGRGVLGDYFSYISPLSTPEQRGQAIENIATDPGGLFFVTGIIKGGVRGAKRLGSLVKRARQKKGLPIEEPPAEKVPVVTEEQIAKEAPKKLSFKEFVESKGLNWREIQKLPYESEKYQTLVKEHKGLKSKRGQMSMKDIILKELAEERKAKEPVPGEAELKMAREPKEKPVTEKPAAKAVKEPVEGQEVIGQLYKEGVEAKKVAGQKGAITVPSSESFGIKGIAEGIKNKIRRVQEGFRKFRFYPEAPAELRNDVRTGPVQIYRNVFTKRSQLETAIFGGLEKAKVEQVSRLIFARDAVARTKANAGKPGVTLEEVTQELIQIEKSITDPKTIKAADNYKKVSDIYRDELIRRDKLEPGQFFEDYAPHLVEDYTPEWAPTFGIPRKMRIPYRPYTKKAVGTTKAYRQTPDVLLDHLAKIEWDNLMEDWLIGQAKKYDITPSLPREQRVALFGTDKAGRVRPWARSGRIIDIEGKRYRAFSPTKPFTRQLFPTEEGTLMALGREKRTYLVPENVYNTFERFSEPGGGTLLYAINRANAYGKSLAILSHFTSFNFNNFVGDAFLGILQHPKKIQFLRNLDDGFRFLVKSPEKYSPYEVEFSKFLTDHAIVDATFIKELPYIYRSKNPLKKILAKSQEVSQFRESIQRIANAKYLFDELKAGRGDQVKQQWDWINTEGLPAEKALGKIGRDSYVDYMAQSKTYNRWIRGFMFPFGTWYFKMSRLVHKMGLKHPIKVGVGLSALPTLAVMFNNRNDEIREMERVLPEFIRDNRVHFVLGKRPDGTIRTLVLQTPQDALIGTKIVTIAINQINQVMNKEKSIQRAAIDTAKNWGIVEGKGILYLMTPLIRFGRGLIDGRDPYDKQRIYPIDVSKLSAQQEWWHRFVYAQKCFMPFLTGYIAETEGRLKPKAQAVKDVVNNFIGLPAFGIRDYNERTQVVLPGGGVIDWDTFSELEKVEQKEASIMLDVKQGFIKSGLMPQEYYGSEEFKKLLLSLKGLHGENFTKELQQSLSKRIANEIENDPITFKMWAGNRFDMAETDEEKRYWGNIFKKARTMQMLQKLKYKPITVREHLPGIVEKATR